MRFTSKLAYAQLRLIGLAAIMVPLVVSAIIGFGGVLVAHLAGEQMATVIMMLLVQLYPVSIGACAVVVLSDDALVELQESMPAGFRAVQTVRLAIVLASGVVGGLILFAPLHAAGVFPNDIGLASVLTPVGGAVIVALAAYVAVSLTGSSHAATMAVIGILLFMTLFWDFQVPDPYTQRLGPMLVACIAAGLAWHAIGRSERLLDKAKGGTR